MKESLSFLFMHAHPDDESINNAITMAKLISEGHKVTLLTSTRGEEGEVLVPELADLASNKKDLLGTHRELELAAAMKILGVKDHRFLGTAERKYRDSGMIGTPQNERPDNFWQCDFDLAVADCLTVMREIKPDVLVTYDEFGGYGHPDHIQTHRVAMAAAEKLSSDWEISKIYWNAFPRSLMEKAIDVLKAQGTSIPGMESAEDMPFLTDDNLITNVVQDSNLVEEKIQAMLAHKTQITPSSEFFALANVLGNGIFGSEYYCQVKGSKVEHKNSEGLGIGLI
jgi:N-acetyl-1-D-myo-inositol-2-amino-2-deoxy-alpha-D-glucopyranoside deacetylase